MRNAMMVATLLAGTILLPTASYADDSDARVARVSYVSGDISYQRGDDEGWNGLRVNTPLVTGDSFFAAEGGRAEVDLGSGIVIRVDGGTQVELVNNTRDIAQLGLTSGLLDLRTRSFPEGFTLEIDTPTGAATILQPGQYRVDVTDQLTTYSVVRGSISLAVDGQQLDVREGESLQLEATDPPTYGYGQLAAVTPFQSWADNRDSRLERSASGRYVNRDVVGYEDLDDHGTWRDNRDYGRVWVPSGISQGWAPYQSGRWIWQDPYGWTWVSYESWGWAPYHYGRWVRTNDDWCWVPPPPLGYRGPAAVMSIQAVYAPALVAFIGGRHWGASLSIGGSAIGWVPLAPTERYYYPWQQAPRVINNYTNITVINAVTIVNYNTFATEAVRPIRVERAQIEQAPVIGFTAVGVVPTRGSLVVSREGNLVSNTSPRGRPERQLVARLVPPPKPQRFTQKVVEIEKTGRPVARPAVNEGAVGKPFVRGAQAPAGVVAVSALAPSAAGHKELSPRGGAEVRPPKRIERDIAPPTPVTRSVAPPPVLPETTPAPPGNQHGKPPQASPDHNTNSNGRNAPVSPRVPPPVPTQPPPVSQAAPSTPATKAVAQSPVRSEATPPPGNQPWKPPQAAQKYDKNPNNKNPNAKNDPMPPPVTQEIHGAPPTKAAAPPPVIPEATPAPGNAPVKPTHDVPKKTKAKGKNAPEPSPTPKPS